MIRVSRGYWCEVVTIEKQMLASKERGIVYKKDPAATGFIDDEQAAAKAKKKKKKGLTEKELDFEQEFADDNEEDLLKEDSQDEEQE